MSKRDTVQIYTDGACRGNPGVGGWAAILECRGREKVVRGAERDTTNNRMELTAAIRGLRAIKKPCEVCVTTDSQYVKNGITQWITRWRQTGWVNSSRKKIKNVDLWQALDEVVAKMESEWGIAISWRWVKGHAGHAGNEKADKLANQAIDDMINEAGGERE